MRKYLLATALVGAVLSATTALAEQRTVAMTAIVEHPAMQAVRDGVIAKLKEEGFDASKVATSYTTAEGQTALAVQIAQRFVGQKPDVIVTISTPSTQAVVSATKDIPIVFAAVSDPVASRIVPRMKQPGGNVTGVSDRPPIAQQLSFMREVIPSIKKIGVIYNSGEANSVANLNTMKEVAEARGFEIVESVATRSADVQMAARSLVGKVDAIYLPPDNTVISAAESAISVAYSEKLPIFSGDPATVERGALGTTGFSYFDIGQEAGAMVVKILNGANPGTIDAIDPTKTTIIVNKTAARKIGVSFPDAILAAASKIVE